MNYKELFKKVCNKETILYVVFGIITTAVDFAVFSVLYFFLGLDEVLSNTLAWIMAVVVAFVTNKVIVFNSIDCGTKELFKEIVSFTLARVASLVITDIFLVLAANIHMNMLLAKALISVVVVIMNYIFSKLFIFRSRRT